MFSSNVVNIVNVVNVATTTSRILHDTLITLKYNGYKWTNLLLKVTSVCPPVILIVSDKLTLRKIAI